MEAAKASAPSTASDADAHADAHADADRYVERHRVAGRGDGDELMVMTLRMQGGLEKCET